MSVRLRIIAVLGTVVWSLRCKTSDFHVTPRRWEARFGGGVRGGLHRDLAQGGERVGRGVEQRGAHIL